MRSRPLACQSWRQPPEPSARLWPAMTAVTPTAHAENSRVSVCIACVQKEPLRPQGGTSWGGGGGLGGTKPTWGPHENVT